MSDPIAVLFGGIRVTCFGRRVSSVEIRCESIGYCSRNPCGLLIEPRDIYIELLGERNGRTAEMKFCPQCALRQGFHLDGAYVSPVEPPIRRHPDFEREIEGSVYKGWLE